MDLAIANVSVAAARAAGAASSLSPCVLPPVPGRVSSTSGNGATRSGEPRTATLGFFSILGSATILAALGASIMPFSRFPGSRSVEADISGGADIRRQGDVTVNGPLGIHRPRLARAFGWKPCVGLIFGAILAVGTVWAVAADGVVLLSCYSLGLGIPFFVVLLFTPGLRGVVKEMCKAGGVLKSGCGLVMVATGPATVTRTLSRFALRPPARPPVLDRVG